MSMTAVELVPVVGQTGYGWTTVTTFARALPHGWAAQEHKLGIT